MKRRLIVSATFAVAACLLLLIALRWTRRAEPPPGTPAAQKSAIPAPENLAPDLRETPAAKLEPRTAAAPAAPVANAPTLQGRVVEEGSLAPLVGAMVRVSLELPGEQDEEARWLVEAESGGAGEFRFDGLPVAAYKVHAALPGHLDGERGRVFPGDSIEVVLPRDAGIPCTLLVERDAGFVALPGHDVALAVPTDNWVLEARTNAAGAFRITGLTRERLEAARLEGRIDPAVPGYAAANLELDAATGDYRITVEEGAEVQGVVLDAATRKPIPLAVVHSESGQEVGVDPRGAFRIAGVAENLTAYAPGYSPDTQDVTELEEGQALRIDFLLQRGVTLGGRVLDGAGKPVAGAWVGLALDALELETDSPSIEEKLRENFGSLTDEAGRYRLQGLPATELDLPGEVELEVRPPGAAAGWAHDVDIQVEAGEIQHDIVLRYAERIPGSVQGFDGKPVPRASIIAQSLEEDSAAVAGTDSAGKFELRSLPLGAHRVRVEVEGRTAYIGERQAPAERWDIRLAAPANLEGRVLAAGSGEPLAGMAVSLLPPKVPGAPAVAAGLATGTDGRFAIRDVPPGNYDLLVKPEKGAAPFSHLEPQHRIGLEVGENGWSGEIAYPVHPSGEVALRFQLKDASGAVLEPQDEVRVAIYSMKARGESRAAVIANPRWNSTVSRPSDGYRTRLREGDYRIRCSVSPGGKEVVKEETVSMAAGGREERTVVFDAPRGP